MRESLKVFQKRPGFAATIVLVLSLCIAANSTLFTIVNSLMLRPLPFPHSEQLVEISIPERRTDLVDLQRARSIELAGAFTAWNYAVKGDDGVRMAYSLRVTPDLIPLLQIRPFLGRTLTRSDFGRHVVMLGYDYWKSLGSRGDITGRMLVLNGEPYSIAGVLPADFFLSVRDAKLIVPDLTTNGRTIARLHPGVTPTQAQADIAGIIPRGQVIPLDRAFYSNDFRLYLVLLASAGIVLLITCANLANLQLVRGLARRREFAIRTAVGASRGRLIVQLIGESAPLGILATVLGLLLARAFHDVTLAILPEYIIRRLSGADALSVDVRVVAFTAAAGIFTVILFGLLPAIGALKFDVMARLRDTGVGSTRERQRFGQVLVISEMALALMLVAGAGLTLKSLLRLQNQSLGFRPEGVISLLTDFFPRRYSRPEQQTALFDEVQRRIGSLPGVIAVGVIAPQVYPFGGPMVRGAPFEIAGEPQKEARAEFYAGNPAYLDSIRLPLIRGRWFTPADNAANQPVAVLSEIVARRYWGTEDPLGHRVRLRSDGESAPWLNVVGVVGDIKNPVALQWQPTIYRPFAQTPYSGAALMIRTSVSDPLSVVPAVRREVHAIDPTAPEIRIVKTLQTAIHDYVVPQRFISQALAIFGVIGLMLAAAGVYGVMRFWVVSRTSEIGVRVALGAKPRDVLRLVLGRAMTAAAFGVAGGIAGTAALQKVIATQLIGVSPFDPVVWAAVPLVLFTAAVLAAWAPAFNASRIDPAEALRRE